MSRDPWDEIVRPACPEACRWRTVCTNLTQSGIAPLWRQGKITQPADCPYFAHREQVHHDATHHADRPAEAGPA